MLQLLRKHGWSWYDDMCGEAAKGGSVPMLMYLKEQGHIFDEQTMTSAARARHLSVCQHLRKEGCPWSASACTAAANRAECFATLRWLLESGCPWDVEAVSVAAAESGSTDVIQYVWQQGARPSAALLTKMLVKACVNDQFLTAKWLRDRGAQWLASMTAVITNVRHISVTYFMYEVIVNAVRLFVLLAYSAVKLLCIAHTDAMSRTTAVCCNAPYHSLSYRTV
eukprot:13486-Heterococcus_DN1.PRE.1